MSALAGFMEPGEAIEEACAREVMEECAAFPNGENDDLVDCVEMGLARYRRGGFIRLSDDERDDDNAGTRRRKAYY